MNNLYQKANGRETGKPVSSARAPHRMIQYRKRVCPPGSTALATLSCDPHPAAPEAATHVTSALLTFSLAFVIAFVTPLLVRFAPWLRMPTAVLEILLGIAAGKSGLHMIATPDWLRVVTRIGLLYLMFLAGLEIRPPQKRAKHGKLPPELLLALASLLSTGALAILSGHLLEYLGFTANANFTALILTTTSLGIVVPILRERSLIARPIGQTLLLAAMAADFATAMLVSAVLRPQDSGWTALAAQFIGLLALGLLLYAGGRWLLRHLSPSDPVVRSSQLGVRGAFALMGICGAATVLLHAEIIAGGFVSGFVCSLLAGEGHSALRAKLETLGYSFFLPLFFVTVGMRLDLTSVNLGAVIEQLPLYLLLGVFVKMGAALAFRSHFSWRTSIAASFLMSTRFTLVMAAAVIAEQNGVIGATEQGTLIAMALATVFLGPLLFNSVLRPEPAAS